MSHGKGALGETKAASGRTRANSGASEIRSLPSAPRPCRKMTSAVAPSSAVRP